MNATLNGRARKTLAQQLDRMDTMLDGLAEGLNEAAATGSMREVVCLAVQQAVRTTLVELLSNAEVQDRLVPRPAPTNGIVAMAQSCWAKVVRWGKQGWNTLLGRTAPDVESASLAIKDAASGATRAIRLLGSNVAKTARKGRMLACVLAALAKQHRFQIATSLAIGCVIGLACWLGGREAASVGCGLSGFAGTLATRAVQRRQSDYLANFQS
ncbi:MAG: hypothetical protein U0744_20805 [Gemmataceae bacterium]